MGRSNSDDYVNVSGLYKAGTPDAILISSDDEDYWIPRSVLDYRTDKDSENYQRGDDITVRVRMWFADKKGMNYDY